MRSGYKRDILTEYLYQYYKMRALGESTHFVLFLTNLAKGVAYGKKRVDGFGGVFGVAQMLVLRFCDVAAVGVGVDL